MAAFFTDLEFAHPWLVLLIAVLAAATAIYIAVGQAFAGASTMVENDSVVTDIEVAATGPLYQLYLLLVLAAFFLYFWLRAGQTLGMQTWRLQLIGDHAALTPHRCLLRLLAALLSWAALGAGYWWVLFDRNNLTWHDRLSGTRVVVLPKKARKAGRS